MMTIDKTLQETYDNSIPIYNIRFQPIYIAWKCYTFLFQDVQKIMKPNHEVFQCHKCLFNKSGLLLELAYDCKILHYKSNQTLTQIFKTIETENYITW